LLLPFERRLLKSALRFCEVVLSQSLDCPRPCGLAFCTLFFYSHINAQLNLGPIFSGKPSRFSKGNVGILAERLFLHLGFLAAYTAKALADGTIKGAKGDKFTAGKLGEFTVGDDNTLLLGEPYRFNKDNIDQFNF